MQIGGGRSFTHIEPPLDFHYKTPAVYITVKFKPCFHIFDGPLTIDKDMGLLEDKPSDHSPISTVGFS